MNNAMSSDERAVAEFREAMDFRESGDLEAAAAKLMDACTPPTIYKAHYRELFRALRTLNRKNLKEKQYFPVVVRILRMIEIDDQMIEHMLIHWGRVQDRQLPDDYFDRDRNLRDSDVKTLERAARQLGNEVLLNNVRQAAGLLRAKHHINVLEAMPLEFQCESLGIELIELDIAGSSNPEDAAYDYYVNHGYIGAKNEGGAIWSMIKAMTLDVLRKYSEFGEEFAVRHFVVGQFETLRNPRRSMRNVVDPDVVVEELIQSVLTVRKAKALKNLEEIASAEANIWGEPLSATFAETFMDFCNREEIANVVRKVVTEPYTYRNGWPDLTLIKGKEMQFVEIKVKDKLHLSQLRTIPDIKPLITAKFLVARLRA